MRRANGQKTRTSCQCFAPKFKIKQFIYEQNVI